MHADLERLAEVSRALGRNTAYVQGAGGNTSLKMSSSLMAVKSSGVLLKDVTPENGFSFVDHAAIGAYMQASDVEEDVFNRTINGFQVEYSGYARKRPSIETSLHAVIPAACVLHSHSVYALIAACSHEGRSEMQRLFGHVSWVPYATPGRALCLAVQQQAHVHGLENVIICANHGLIVTGADVDAAYQRHEDVNRRLRQAFDAPAFEQAERRLYDDMRERALFPDQVVYTHTDRDVKNNNEAQEIFDAYAYVRHTIEHCGFTPQYLTSDDVATIAALESEKYRRKLIEQR